MTFREFHDSFRPLRKGRMFFRSKYEVAVDTPKGKKIVWATATYRRPKAQ